MARRVFAVLVSFALAAGVALAVAGKPPTARPPVPDVFAAGPAARGAYADWTGAGQSGSWSGAMDPPAAGFPAAGWMSDASTVKAPSGASAFLGPKTPVGAKYGSSEGRPYLNISTAPGLANSVTTLTFDRPTPARDWAFVLGDVDADEVVISATDARGNAVSADELGFAGVFNYCATSPKPSACTGPGPFDDVPTWHPGSSRLTGNGPDTAGASGWFEPTVPLASISFKFKKITGIPVFQLWVTTLAVPVTADIDGVSPSNPVPSPGIELGLQDTDGRPVIDGGGEPATAVVDPSGHAEFPAVVDGDYTVVIHVPPGVSNLGATKVAIRVRPAKGPTRIPPGVFAVVVPLPPTGTDGGPLAWWGLALVTLGGLLLVGVRRRVE